MKVYKLLFFVFFATVFLFVSKSSVQAFDPYRPLCVGIQGKFTTSGKWTGGPIQVGCAGDNGGAVPASQRASKACLGEVQKNIYPGETFRLTKCSCLGSNKGCLKMGKELRLEPLVNGKRLITIVKNVKDMPEFKNNQCRHTDLRPYCAANGAHITGNIKITCNAPSPTPKPSKTPTPRPSGTPTPKPSLSPTPGPSECPGPTKVTNVKVTCPNCFSEPTPTGDPDQ